MLTDEEMKQITESMSVVDDMVENIFENHSMDEQEGDPFDILFGLFVTSIQFLSECGWTKEELKQEIETHYPEKDSIKEE